MSWIDLTHTLFSGMPVYPGDEPPFFDEVATLADYGYRERRIQMGSHAGTHMDAPAHMLEGGQTLDQMPLDAFMGRGFVLDARELKSIERCHLEAFESAISTCDFLLLHTGWSERWGRPDYFEGYPCLTQEAALYLAEKKLKGIGVDSPSVDAVDSADYPIHKSLLERGFVIIENLFNLDQLLGKSFEFYALPMKLENAEGSPVRAMARVDYETHACRSF